MIGSLAWSLLTALDEGRLTSYHAQDRVGDYSQRQVRRKLEEIEDKGLVRRVEPRGRALYEITDRGETAVELHREYRRDDEMDRVEFRLRVDQQVFGFDRSDSDDDGGS